MRLVMAPVSNAGGSANAIPNTSFQTAPNTIIRNGGTGCPYCTGMSVSSDNSLASLYPDVAEEWFHERNDLRPDEVVAHSHKKYWWRCSRVPSHIWEAPPGQRVEKKSGCPQCNRGAPINLRKFPVVLAQFDAKKNPGVDPTKLRRFNKYWWKCDRASGSQK